MDDINQTTSDNPTPDERCAEQKTLGIGARGHCSVEAFVGTPQLIASGATSNLQALHELRRAVAFHDEVAASVQAGEGVTAAAAVSFAQKWLLRAARGAVLQMGDQLPQRSLDS